MNGCRYLFAYLLALLLILILLVPTLSSLQTANTAPTVGTSTESSTCLSDNATHHMPMNAAFVATAYRLDFPKSDPITKESLEEELSTLVETAKAAGINTLIFQVRPFSDAFYASEIFPTSRYLVGNEGEAAPIDVLAVLLEKAHAKGLAVHAWINPYRIGSHPLSAEHPAVKHPDYLFYQNGKLYFHPSLPEVQELIVSGVREIVSSYAVDGILFDDYYYPEGMKSEDAALYEAYRQSGGELSLGDFRREAVNSLIRKTYTALKSIAPDCLFGVSPRGIWRNLSEDPNGSDTRGQSAYDEIYCDALAWVREKTVDYLVPQLYWSYSTEGAEFALLADWWQKQLDGSEIALIPALAAYRLPKEEIKAQIHYLTHKPGYEGYALYRWSNLNGESGE